MNHNGIVYLVGAGPGNPGLITIRGAQLLAECQAVVYDRLCPIEWVVPLPEEVERHYVGKARQGHSKPQEEINQLLISLAEQGKKVVRLKGGDPFIFGRGGEEAICLQERGIRFEVVPGVTAGLAAGAYSGIPATHRGTSVFVMLLTAHETPVKGEGQMPWDWIGRAQGGTLVGYMGVKQLPYVVENLLAAGMPGETPAAVIEQAATGRQKVICGTLAQLPDQAQAEKIQPPAAFIIGETVRLHEKLNWVGAERLSGKTVMVTRPVPQAKEMYSRLRELGAEVLPLPTISISEDKELGVWEELNPLFKSADCEGGKSPWLVFTSENGVRFFLKQLWEQGFDGRALGSFKIAAVGSGTQQELARHRFKTDFLPSQATTATLARELAQVVEGKASGVIRIRGNLGDQTVEDSLAAAGAQIFPLRVYKTRTARWDAGMWAAFEENPPDIITFTSGSTVTGFSEILGEGRTRQLAQKAVIASIGPLTTRTLSEKGFQVHIEAREHSVPGLIQALVEYYQNHPDLASGSRL